MDISTLGGFIAAIVFIVVSILLGGELLTFYDAASVMITIGGAFASSFIAYPLKGAIAGLKGIKFAFASKKIDSTETIKKLIELSNMARKEGLLSLEEASNNIDDEFLKKGLLLIIDGTEPELVRGILDTEIYHMQVRHNTVSGYWDKIGELGPAWGMIGTLVGLINMLKNLSDPTTIGPSMAVALITTFYGSLLANLIAIPMANKMKMRSSEESDARGILVEGILSIQAGENPKVIEEKLKAYLAPSMRKAFDAPEVGGA